jgi:hypothetical protein
MLKAFIPALLLIAAAAPAGATCKQADIAGTWTAYSIGKDSANNQLAWVSCNLVINTAGRFSTGTSSCTASGKTVGLQGMLKLSGPAKCLYSGSFTIPEAPHTDPIPALTLSLDKQTASGAGGHNGTTDVFVLTMVKTQ